MLRFLLVVGGRQVDYIWACLPEIPLTAVLEHGIAALWYLEGSIRAVWKRVTATEFYH